jgi:MYXO-CTERM domain-containing protein
MINSNFTLKTVALACCMLSGAAVAGHMPNHNPGGSGSGGDDSANFVDLKTCKLTDMELTYLRALEPANQPQQPIPAEQGPIYANDCYGYVVGNNSDMALPGDNLGYDNDGWFNMQTGLWVDGAFDPELLDLDGDTQVDDPGWVYMGKDDGAGFKGTTIPNDDPDKEYTFVDDLFSCSTTVDGTYGTCVNYISGFWKFTPPSTQPALLIDLLGGSFFDQVAVVFKGGNGFAIYNFTLSQLGLDPILAGDTKYEFGGKFDLSGTIVNKGGQPAGLSNISLWARDPFLPTQVSEPGYLALLGLALLALYRRRRLQ